jgi:hypothetical protein
MKEKIKLLVEKTGTDVSEKWISVDRAEKFANLLIEDLVKQLNENSNQHWQTNYLGGWTDATRLIKQYLD